MASKGKGTSKETEDICYSMSESENGYYYNRRGHKEEKEVCRLLAECHECPTKNVCLTTSGVDAISTTITILTKYSDKFNIVYSNELYCDSVRYFRYLEGYYVKLFPFDIQRQSSLIRLVQDNTCLQREMVILFVESCSNPNGYVFDFTLIPRLRKMCKNLLVIVDNTWLTHVIFNPLKHDADVIVSSMSKHYSNGNCIGGFIIAGTNGSMANFVKDLTYHVKVCGTHISIPYCQMYLEAIPRMTERIHVASAKLRHILSELSQIPAIILINYPLYDTHPSKGLAKRYFKEGVGPTLLSFVVNGQKKETLEWMRQFPTIKLKTSFGSYDTKLDPWPKSDGSTTTCRLSIGYDSDVESIVEEIKMMMKK